MRVVIAARMNSSRLPGKALLPIFKDLSMLDVLVHRIRKSKLVSGIILATSKQNTDDPLEEWTKKNDIDIYRGSLDDVLGRLSECIRFFDLENFVEILGDNPLVDPKDIDLCINNFINESNDYVATSTTEYDYANPQDSYPIGVRVQCIKSKLIHHASKNLHDAHSREHSSSFIYKSNDKYKTNLISYSSPAIKDAFKLNLAVNTLSDFNRTRDLFKACGIDVTLDEALKFLINKI